MAFCSKCGAELREGAKFCPECGAPASEREAALPERERKSSGKKRSLLTRWWFWVLILAVVGGLGRMGSRTAKGPEPAAAVTTAQTQAPTAAPTETPAPTPEPTEAPKDGIRPEVREFLDSYEAFMDEYVEFMRRYMKADASAMVSMMGDHYDILARDTDFADKIEAMDESELNSAELAYYLEVTGRVSQKLLTVAGG